MGEGVVEGIMTVSCGFGVCGCQPYFRCLLCCTRSDAAAQLLTPLTLTWHELTAPPPPPPPSPPSLNTHHRHNHTLTLSPRAYDKLTTRQEKPLERTKRAFRSVSTSDDPVIRSEWMMKGRGREEGWGEQAGRGRGRGGREEEAGGGGGEQEGDRAGGRAGGGKQQGGGEKLGVAEGNSDMTVPLLVLHAVV